MKSVLSRVSAKLIMLISLSSCAHREGVAVRAEAMRRLALGCFTISADSGQVQQDSLWIASVGKVVARDEPMTSPMPRATNLRYLKTDLPTHAWVTDQNFWYVDSGATNVHWVIGDMYSVHEMRLIPAQDEFAAQLTFSTDEAPFHRSPRGVVKVRRASCT